MSDNDDENTSFGFKEVKRSEKQGLVKGVFSSVASNYDLMNDLMSLGVHRYWKDKMISQIDSPSGYLLDVAGGTGDITSLFYKKAKKYGIEKPKALMSDINFDMLYEGKKRLIDENITDVDLACANAENLPFKDNVFDYYTIAFGIRNVTNIDIALKEAFRVLKPGGKFICLEFSKVTNENLAKLYEFYSFNIIPKIGKFVAKDENSYQYLAESIAKFPNQMKFENMIKDAGFKMTKYQNLTFGVVALHTGFRM